MSRKRCRVQVLDVKKWLLLVCVAFVLTGCSEEGIHFNMFRKELVEVKGEPVAIEENDTTYVYESSPQYGYPCQEVYSFPLDGEGLYSYGYRFFIDSIADGCEKFEDLKQQMTQQYGSYYHIDLSNIKKCKRCGEIVNDPDKTKCENCGSWQLVFLKDLSEWDEYDSLFIQWLTDSDYTMLLLSKNQGLRILHEDK